MPDVLLRIIKERRAALETQKKRVSLGQLRERLRKLSTRPRPFEMALRETPGMAIIAEVKQASPSAGKIRDSFDLAQVIKAYEQGGACALSILTEERYFQGSSDHLRQARALTSLPLLRKDFIVDAYQMIESRVLGADAILLISALFSTKGLEAFLQQARTLRLDVLVEVHEEAELKKALEAGATLIGINNRNLRNLTVDLATAERLIPLIPRDRAIIVESGIQNLEQVAFFKTLGAKAVLIGESLMRREDPTRALRAFVETGRAG